MTIFAGDTVDRYVESFIDTPIGELMGRVSGNPAMEKCLPSYTGTPARPVRQSFCAGNSTVYFVFAGATADPDLIALRSCV